MTNHAFDTTINDLRFTADVCPRCAGLPTELDALRAMEARRPREPICAACGEIFRMLSVSLRHAPEPDQPGQERWVAGMTVYIDVLRLEGVGGYSLMAHGTCVARSFPFLPEARRDQIIQLRRQGMPSIQAGVEDRWTSEPLEPTAPGTPTCFYGDFEEVLDPDGSIHIPAGWASGERDLTAVLSHVPHEHCVRVYEASAWARTLVAIRAYRSPEPTEIRSLEVSRGGKLQLPMDLLAKIDVRDKVHVAGVVDWFDLWSPAGWEAATCPAAPMKTLWSGRAGQ